MSLKPEQENLIGVVDLGTVSLRFDVFKPFPLPKPPEVHLRHRSMPRLGEDLYSRGEISANTWQNLLQEFRIIRQKADEIGVRSITAVGTSALREYAKSAELVAEIFQESGISLRLISGEDEARLTAQGILTYEELPIGTPALVDIGGGSTEITFCRERRAELSLSIETGALRILRQFGNTSETAPSIEHQRIPEIRKFLRDTLEERLSSAKQFAPSYLIGSSGTARALEKLLPPGVHTRLRVYPNQLETLIHRFAGLTPSQLKSIPGMDPLRADIVLPGALILQFVTEFVGAEFIILTSYSLRHGILVNELSEGFMGS